MVAVPPPPVTFPATRLIVFTLSDFAPFELTFSKRVCLFLSKQIKKPVLLLQQAFRLRNKVYR